MNRLIWIIGIVSGSSVDRLRYLHDQLVACFPDQVRDGAVSEETLSQLVSSGSRFARNDAERELDTFVEIYRVLHKEDVGRSGLDDMRWAIAECLYRGVSSTEAQTVQSQVQRLELGEAEATVVELGETETKRVEGEVNPTIISEVLEDEGSPVSRKRPMEAEKVDSIKDELVPTPFIEEAPMVKKRKQDETPNTPSSRKIRTLSFEASVAARLLRICKDAGQYMSDVPVGTRFLAKQHVDMVRTAQWQKLNDRLEVFSLVKAKNMEELFCDAYQVKQGSAPRLRIAQKGEEFMKSKWIKRTKTDFVSWLGQITAWARSEPLSEDVEPLAQWFIEKAQEGGDLEALQDARNALSAAQVSNSDIGKALGLAYEYLSTH